MPLSTTADSLDADNPSRGSRRALHTSVDALRRVLRELRVIARKSELAAGLSAAQVFVLTTLAGRPSMSVNEVAAATMTDRSSAAAVIDRLVKLGYATREPSADDRRRAAISLSTAGRRALRDAAPPPTAVLIAAIRRLSSAEQKHLAAGLSALTREMGVATGPAGMLFEEIPRASRPRQNRGRRRG